MKRIIFIVSMLLSFTLNAQLKINELMTNNVSAVLDDYYNYSMWVELYNPSTITSYNQSGYYFTDDLKQPKKWNPLAKMISPKGYSLLWFERDDRYGHASFKLNPEGGKLYMLNTLLQVVDSVIYPPQYRNVSYGRQSDGVSQWTFFEQYSQGTSNNNKTSAVQRCIKPVFQTQGGFFPTSINLTFETPQPGDTIYYTRNGSEPTRTNYIRYIPGSAISITSNSLIRAKIFSAGKLSSDIVTNSYFIGQREFNLPVVSIVTQQANLTDNTIGLYVAGTNGIIGNGSNTPVNWNQDWDRPVNFELFDKNKVQKVNQEVDISISGGWSRLNPQKSLKIQPKKKFGDNRLNYDFFSASKPDRKYKDIQVRNSGNDFYYSMFRDAFMESLVANRMDVDYLAYEPAIMFMNGTYYGIQNLRETSGKDFVYSNYGLDDTEINLLESGEISVDTSYLPLSNYITQNDITKPAVYNKVCEMMDVDNFMNYMISEIYYANTDWPGNNVKIWKKKAGGKWRWIMYDTDFGYNIFDSNAYTHNTLSWALGETLPLNYATVEWATLLLRRLILNDVFRKKFIDRFSIQLSGTFETNRVNHIMDSISAKITKEIAYHKTLWGSYRNFNDDIAYMKIFSLYRPDKMLGFLSSRFLSSAPVQTIQLSSNVNGTSYYFNSEPVLDANVKLKYFKNLSVALEAKPVQGYKFKQWEFMNESATGSLSLISYGSNWKYNDGNSMPSTSWNTNGYDDSLWKNGNAQLGYGGKGEVTTISYGSDPNNKYTTAYFRKSLTINDLEHKNNFLISILVDDGAAVYVNGQEIGRYNLPAGQLSFSTLAPNYNNGDRISYSVPQNLLKEGENNIAVEIHQNAVNSSDLMFDLQMTCNVLTYQIITNPVFTSTLTENIILKAVYEESEENNSENVDVKINEVVSSNNLISDEFGGKDDYIELYNSGDKTQNIAGWYLTDTPSNRLLAQIPVTDSAKTEIPAKGRLIIWADDQAEQGLLHVPFKLSKDGETIILSRKDNNGFLQLVDSVSFPAMDANLSYSRVPDGAANWIVQKTTFNETNDDLSAIEQFKTMVQLYPTVINESFRVVNANQCVLTISDLTGKVLYKNTCKSDNEVIQVGYLKQGLYVAAVGDKAFKIIKL